MRYLLFPLVLLVGCQQSASPPPDASHAADSAQAASPSEPAAEPARDWRVNTTTHPADGSTTVVLYRGAMEVRAHSALHTPILYVRCKRGATELYIDWHDYIPGSTHQVTTRLDRGPTQARMWSLSRSNVATFYPDSPVDFLQALMQADLLYTEATPYNTSPVTAVFDVEGLAEAIQPLRTQCGW